MHLINKQDDAALLLVEVVQYRLESFLEFAAKFRSGDERTHVQRQHTLAFQRLGDFAVDYSLRQTLDNSRFAHTGFPDQYGIVFRSSLQDLDSAANLLIPAYDRIQFPLVGLIGQIYGKFIQCAPVVFTVRVVDVFSAAYLVYCHLYITFIGAALSHEFPQR